MTSDLEREVRRNLELRNELGIEIAKVRDRSEYRFAVGKPEYQPVISAILIMLFALTLWYFLWRRLTLRGALMLCSKRGPTRAYTCSFQEVLIWLEFRMANFIDKVFKGPDQRPLA